MKLSNLKILAAIFCLGTQSYAKSNETPIHTRDHDVVCSLNDFLGTKLYIDCDATFDKELGKLSSKLLEMPTKNAFANNNHLFQVELIAVKRGPSLNCGEPQTILFISEGVGGIINKLDYDGSKAKITRNVDLDGNSVDPSFMDAGPCEPNKSN